MEKADILIWTTAAGAGSSSIANINWMVNKWKQMSLTDLAYVRWYKAFHCTGISVQMTQLRGQLKWTQILFKYDKVIQGFVICGKNQSKQAIKM